MTALLHREMPDTMAAWSQAAGLGTIKPLAVDFFDSGGLMLEAAAQGLGVAFMHASHFNHANDPRLVRLFPEIEVISPYSHWFVSRPRAMQTKPVKLFHDWLFVNLKE